MHPRPTRHRLVPTLSSTPDQILTGPEPAPSSSRPPCPAPARIHAEVARYDQAAQVGCWHGPRYRMTYRTLGDGPPLFLIPGIASTYRVYALLLNRLGAHFRTILYDYPG